MKTKKSRPIIAERISSKSAVLVPVAGVTLLGMRPRVLNLASICASSVESKTPEMSGIVRIVRKRVRIC